MANQTTRRPALATEDAFIARTAEATAWARHNSRIVTTVLIVVALGIAALIYYRNYREKLQERAGSELTQIRQTLLSGNKALAIKDLETYIRKFGSTPSGSEARILLGQAYLETNQAPKAITTVKPLADDLGSPLGPPAAFLLGAAYEATKQPKNAENTYLRIGDDARMQFQRRDALESAARLRADNGNVPGAQQLYERLVKMTPDSVQAHEIYEMRLNELKARNQTAGKS